MTSSRRPFQSLIHQGKNASKRIFCRSFSGRPAVSIPYSSGEKCKQTFAMELTAVLEEQFQSLIHQGKNASHGLRRQMVHRYIKEPFQSLIHQGKNARSISKHSVRSNSRCRFNPLFIRGKMQALIRGRWSSRPSGARCFNPLFIRGKMQAPSRERSI